jgi:hypothetical protein
MQNAGRRDAGARLEIALFLISLESLLPGRDDCQVTMIEPTGKRAAFWQAPVAIVP